MKVPGDIKQLILKQIVVNRNIPMQVELLSETRSIKVMCCDYAFYNDYFICFENNYMKKGKHKIRFDSYDGWIIFPISYYRSKLK